MTPAGADTASGARNSLRLHVPRSPRRAASCLPPAGTRVAVFPVMHARPMPPEPLVSPHPPDRRRSRAPARWRAASVSALLALLGCLATGPARAQDATTAAPPAGEQARALVITRVEFTGLTRTPLARAERAAGLAAPLPASAEVISEAADRLRASRLFRSVTAHTRPGERPGDVVLVFEVEENRPHLRFGLGYEDFSSWYLIPVQLNADNLTGHGEGLTLGARLGYRVSALELALRRPGRASSLDFWELKLRAESLDRLYFLDSTETRHHLDRGGLELRAGRRLGGSFALEGWAGTENTQVDSNAVVHTERATLGRERGDEVPFASLPSQIQRDVRERTQGRVGLALKWDRRTGTGLRARGAWARLAGEAAFSGYGDFGSWQADVRAYAPLGRDVQLAARVRAGAVSHEAPFYERFYVGGLYTVRGYADQALSPPQGNLNMGAGSLELRHAWMGDPANPRFSALVFVDAGTGWNRDAPSSGDVAWSAGAGFRWRVPWLGQIGIDAARPLSDSPVEEAFHLHGSLGWAF